ncbi:SUKH-3 domain-containing protein [Hymenobacter sp. BT664]|uniref:SUKH-3 domain-containing protein n=1 Tax=Hymenobacter montanus TaxID=2771359 RepID=A0A927BF01_9BACT|nr:SUKH-3 domain-containing protein [Hymenobacter montanus]MBD2769035.1 SUKH-3 domain-containing protein [Hymenobacter montanus]
MTRNKGPSQIVGDFLIRFYHEEPDDTKASTKALRAITGMFDYEWEVASTFKELLEMTLPVNTLRDMVRVKANRLWNLPIKVMILTRQWILVKSKIELREDMNFISEETKVLLEKAGWSEARRVSIEEYENHLEKLGYPKFPVALEFLRRFGGLQISESPQGESQRSYNLKVDPLKLTQCYPPYVFAAFEEGLGRPLCPVALADNGHSAIAMDEAGRFYCMDGSALFHVADSIYEAIQILSHTNWPKFDKVLELD